MSASNDTSDQPAAAGLLDPDEPAPFLALNRQGSSRFVIAVDHASRMIPQSLGDLGLPDAELKRHIAWDIGSLAVAHRVATLLDAPLVAQNYSRLVIDCNRPLDSPESIPTVSEHIEIPGNRHLTAEQIAARRREIFLPYHEHLRQLLDERAAAGRPTILVAQHSMTDIYKDERRPMQAAVLYNRDPRLARLVLALLQRDGVIVGDNDPYVVSDEGDYTIPVHGEARGLPHVAIEIRQDLIAGHAGQAAWAERIAAVLRTAETLLPPAVV
jgi:predicted N-formylglutamate amidohydrolase